MYCRLLISVFADTRDLTAAWNAGRTEGWHFGTGVGVVMAGLAFVPIVGDLAKAGVKPLFGKPASIVTDVAKGADELASLGRSGKQAKLRELAIDPKVSSADRGWIQQEINSIDRGQRLNIRVPFGKHLAHNRGFEAKKGFGYKHSQLQDIDLHKLQHKHGGY